MSPGVPEASAARAAHASGAGVARAAGTRWPARPRRTVLGGTRAVPSGCDAPPERARAITLNGLGARGMYPYGISPRSPARRPPPATTRPVRDSRPPPRRGPSPPGTRRPTGRQRPDRGTRRARHRRAGCGAAGRDGHRRLAGTGRAGHRSHRRRRRVRPGPGARRLRGDLHAGRIRPPATRRREPDGGEPARPRRDVDPRGDRGGSRRGGRHPPSRLPDPPRAPARGRLGDRRRRSRRPRVGLDGRRPQRAPRLGDPGGCDHEPLPAEPALPRLHRLAAPGPAPGHRRVPERGAHQRAVRRHRAVRPLPAVRNRPDAAQRRRRPHLRAERPGRRPRPRSQERLRQRGIPRRDLRRVVRALHRHRRVRRQPRGLGVLRRRLAFLGRGMARRFAVRGHPGLRRRRLPGRRGGRRPQLHLRRHQPDRERRRPGGAARHRPLGGVHLPRQDRQPARVRAGPRQRRGLRHLVGAGDGLLPRPRPPHPERRRGGVRGVRGRRPAGGGPGPDALFRRRR